MGINDLNLAIVDVETTGGNPIEDRIIEVGVLKIEQGKVVEQYNSFVNPYRELSPLITELTGITDADLAGAPDFSDISGDLTELLRNSVFVAHNVYFDYNFIKTEFAGRDQAFNPTRLCTVKLSRSLYPKYRHHNLDSLIERFNIACQNRHRALDDAQVLWKFLQRAQQDFTPKHLGDTVSRLLQTPQLEPLRYAPL